MGLEVARFGIDNRWHESGNTSMLDAHCHIEFSAIDKYRMQSRFLSGFSAIASRSIGGRADCLNRSAKDHPWANSGLPNEVSQR